MEGDDPWEWDTDRVVKEFCVESRSRSDIPSHSRLPDPKDFEPILRENQITGGNILNDLDHKVLQDLGIKVLNQRAAILYAVRALRNRSSGYTKYHAQLLGAPSLATTIPLPQTQEPSLSLQTPSGLTPLTETTTVHTSPTSSTNSGTWNGEASVTKRARTHFAQDESHPLFEESLSSRVIDETSGQDRQSTNASHEAEPQISESAPSQRKRKRIAPILISAAVDPDRDRSIQTQADAVIFNNPDNMVPGRMYLGDDGKKRMVPVSAHGDYADLATNRTQRLHGNLDLQQGGEIALQAAKDIISSIVHDPKSIQPLERGYLGKSKVTVDDVFYGDLPLGADLGELDDPVDFSQISEPISSGRRLYRHKLLKSFLQSDRRVIKRNQKSFSAIQPYAKRLLPMHEAPSFTLYHATPNGIIRATRENLMKWPEADPDVGSRTVKDNNEHDRGAQFDLPDNLPIGTTNTYEDWDESLLEKWRYLEGGDKILPLYGESDSEGEFDLETWKEMEEEHGVLEAPKLTSKRKGLTDEEINVAIDEGIANLVLKWNEEKLPKRKGKAWKLWHKAVKDRSRRDQLRQAHQKLDRLNNDRIRKFRHEILTEHWTRAKQVHQQTRIMEQSIFDREDLAWEISVLESKTAPDKPLPLETVPVPRKKSHASEDVVEEDGESIESTSDLQSSDDGLDDFVVSDDSDAEVPVEHILDFDEDDTESSQSDQPLSVNDRPKNRLLKFEQRGFTKTAVTSHSGDDSDDNDVTMFDITDSGQREEGRQHSMEDLSSVQPAKIKEEKTTGPVTPMNHRVQEVVSLLSSEEEETRIKSSASKTVINLVTPTKPFMRPPQLTPQGPRVKLIYKGNGNSKEQAAEPDTGSIVTISDSEAEIDLHHLPKLTDIKGITSAGRSTWIRIRDEERLLISMLARLRKHTQEEIRAMLMSMSEDLLWTNMLEVMQAVVTEKSKVKGIDESSFLVYTGILRLFNVYIHCSTEKDMSTLGKATTQSIKKSKARWARFNVICLRTLKQLLGPDHSEARSKPVQNHQAPLPSAVAEITDDEEEPRSATRRQARRDTSTEENDDSEQVEPRSARKLRKRTIFENTEARSQREQDHERLLEQEERRRILHAKLAQSSDFINAESGRVIVNDAKRDEEGFVYVHDEIAKRIKKHQIEGVRFMWSQVVEGKQGCLLAHTMGLGKTMQVITLLVAIAEAANSDEENVYSLVPERLRRSHTLVICPPGLIDNWMDELLTWAPEGVLGDLRKIDASIKTMDKRLETISDWNEDGGVLVMGYEMLRLLVTNKETDKRAAALDPETHELVKQWLLEGPNIIVADEAHKMKNATAALTLATTQFVSKSRIALTGSPLANNVEEYHTMIEWIAPNYLGPAVEFRAKYVEPIQHGMYADSTSYERRKSLKMLGVLKEDLAPKVHRADMSVLRNYLKQKTEFVIVVPLTNLQEQAYSIYVHSMLASPYVTNKDGRMTQSTLWHWLAVLALLCNHPECFKRKLQESKDIAEKLLSDKKKKKRSTSEEEPEESSTWKVGVSESLVQEELALFDKFDGDITDPALSHKTAILVQILDEAKAVKDKVLVFSQSIPTLDFLERLCLKTDRTYARLDGKTTMSKRQGMTKKFNTGTADLYLISTTAGGLGLNLPGANRVVIFDFKFNPIMEEQAIGRAYRIGQQKPVFVYRLVAGGTFEDRIHNLAVFKMQLASKVVDKKNPILWAKKKAGDFLFVPQPVKQEDLKEYMDKDPLVLGSILGRGCSNIRSIVVTDIFERHDDDILTIEEEREVKQLLSEEQLKRTDPVKYNQVIAKRQLDAIAQAQKNRLAAEAAAEVERQRYVASYSALAASVPPVSTAPEQATSQPVNSSQTIQLPTSTMPLPLSEVTVLPPRNPPPGFASARPFAPTPTTMSHKPFITGHNAPTFGAGTKIYEIPKQSSPANAGNPTTPPRRRPIIDVSSLSSGQRVSDSQSSQGTGAREVAMNRQASQTSNSSPDPFLRTRDSRSVPSDVRNKTSPRVVEVSSNSVSPLLETSAASRPQPPSSVLDGDQNLESQMRPATNGQSQPSSKPNPTTPTNKHHDILEKIQSRRRQGPSSTSSKAREMFRAKPGKQGLRNTSRDHRDFTAAPSHGSKSDQAKSGNDQRTKSPVKPPEASLPSWANELITKATSSSKHHPRRNGMAKR